MDHDPSTVIGSNDWKEGVLLHHEGHDTGPHTSCTRTQGKTEKGSPFDDTCPETGFFPLKPQQLRDFVRF